MTTREHGETLGGTGILLIIMMVVGTNAYGFVKLPELSTEKIEFSSV